MDKVIDLGQLRSELQVEDDFKSPPSLLQEILAVTEDPRSGAKDVQAIVERDMSCAVKLLRLANSVAINPGGVRIADLSAAIGRLGFDIVRTTSLAVAMDQMLKSRHLASYDNISRQTWEYSIQVAAIARVLARHLGRVNPDQAMLTGLVHNIGVFYLMYRAAEYPEYRSNEPAMIELLLGWHEGIGESLLHILGVPTQITDAVRDQSQIRNVETPCTLADILYFAKQLADSKPQWQLAYLNGHDAAAEEENRLRYADLLHEAEEDILDLRAALSA